MRRLALALLLLALAGVARPATAQNEPAPAPEPTPRACPNCDDADTLRARAEEKRAEAERRYEAAAQLYDAMRDKGDSASRAEYENAVRDYEAARQAYRETINKYTRAMYETMRRRADSMARSMYQRPTGWLGITYSGDFQTKSLNGKAVMRFSEYPVIESVEPDSPAEKGGVESGDVLVAIDGKDVVQGCPTFKELLHPGNHLAFRLKRARATIERVVVVEKRPSEWTPMPGFAPHAPEAPTAPRAPRAATAPEPPEAPLPPDVAWATPMPPSAAIDVELPESGFNVHVIWDNAMVAGAHLQKFDELKSYFGVDSGVLVLRVLPGTPAARAGLKGGDVIMKANGKSVTTPMQFARAVEYAHRGPLTLLIMRQRKTQTLTLKR